MFTVMVIAQCLQQSLCFIYGYFLQWYKSDTWQFGDRKVMLCVYLYSRLMTKTCVDHQNQSSEFLFMDNAYNFNFSKWDG